MCWRICRHTMEVHSLVGFVHMRTLSNLSVIIIFGGVVSCMGAGWGDERSAS